MLMIILRLTKSLLSIISVSLVILGSAHAGNFGIGGHGGYGVIKYEERASASGVKRKSEAALSTVIFGLSGEYSFEKYPDFFTGITTDWTVGFKDEETLKKNGGEFQTNDLRVFGQFYDVRLGYKNSRGQMYYRLYLSGGWDGIHLSRSDLTRDGEERSGSFKKDFSLWRAGAGAGLGYKFGKWAVDGRGAYSLYPKGTAKDSEFSGVEFRTGGTCLDLGLGIAYELSERVNLYAGASYTRLELDEDSERGVVLPESTTRMLFGVMNLTYAF